MQHNLSQTLKLVCCCGKKYDYAPSISDRAIKRKGRKKVHSNFLTRLKIVTLVDYKDVCPYESTVYMI